MLTPASHTHFDFMANQLHIIILAAGIGSRMHSSIPKVLHPLAGKPLLGWVIDAASLLNPAAIHVIYGYGKDKLRAFFKESKVNWIEQPEQLGTADAVARALPFINPEAQILVLSGDVPLIQAATLDKLITNIEALNLLFANVSNPYGFGRIVRDSDNAILRIVEEKDASPREKAIQEVYTGICAGSAAIFKRLIPLIKPHNSQKEYYLTDLVDLAMQHNTPIQGFNVLDEMETCGVNTQNQLATLERYWQRHQALLLQEKGVYIADPARIDIRGTLTVEQDVFIDVDVVFEGNNTLKKGSKVGPFCILKDVILGEQSEVFSHSVLEKTVIKENCKIGPFARLRKGTELQNNCKIGNFVETKEAKFAEGSKANHLSYIGDASIGKEVNIGAGTITCNYDGVEKHQTSIEDYAFIGSGTQLVAPITVGHNATIGAGTTLRQDAPANALTLSSKQQITHANWQRKKSKKSTREL